MYFSICLIRCCRVVMKYIPRAAGINNAIKPSIMAIKGISTLFEVNCFPRVEIHNGIITENADWGWPPNENT